MVGIWHLASGIWHLACQTYALNLIDSQGGQSRAPQLFSSSKSFRVAKSTPSSGSLPPISKRLSKPPLLSKSALFFAPLLLLSYTQGIQALTAQTSREIKGSAPYLTFDGGQTKATNTDTFLAIELPDGRVITPSTNTSSATNPIRLSSGNYTFNDIHTVVPASAPWANRRYSIGINDLVSQGKWGDDDGDGQVTATGSISVEFGDRNNNRFYRTVRLSACGYYPYTVTLDSTGGSLTTRYGVPNRSTFSGGRVTYYLMPSQPEICSVRPNLERGTGNYAGPSYLWNPNKGFLTQSTNPSSYDRNFPTTGADGLYFDLEIPSGVNASQLNWTVNTSGSIRATVTNARVTLTGPRASSSQISSSNPGSLTRPVLPQTFELVGRDSSGNEVRYGFVLRQWFVSRSNKYDTPPNQTAWCRSLGYRLSKVSDLTNAMCGVDNSWFPCVNSINGATPRASDNNYMRHIGAGFFTEWGYMSNYADAGFVNAHYWTSDATGSGQFGVYSGYGYVISSSASYSNYAVCTTP